MKKKGVAALALSVGCLLCATGCGNADYSALIEQTNESVAYIGVRTNQKIVSNKYTERDLTELGLDEDAEFLYGNDKEMFFAEKTSKQVTVKAYNFAEETIRECTNVSYGNLVHVAMADSNYFYCFYFEDALWNSAWKVDRCGINGGQAEVNSEIYAPGALSEAEQATKIANFMNGLRLYKWVYEAPSSGISFYSLTYYRLEAYGERHDVFHSETNDPVWNYIYNESNGRAWGKGFYEANEEGIAVIDIAYECPNLMTYVAEHDNYFIYNCDDKTIEFLFAEEESKNPITGLYVVNN